MIDVSDRGQQYPRLDEYSPNDLEKLKDRFLMPRIVIDPFINMWGVIQTTYEVKQIEEFSSISNQQLVFFLNYLQILSEIRNRKILFSIINIQKSTVQELDYQLFPENEQLLVKSYNWKPFTTLITFVMQPNGAWFVLIIDFNRKFIDLIDFHREKDDPTVKESFDIMHDVLKDLYELDIFDYKMQAKVKKIEDGDTNDTRIFYLLYIYKFIRQAKFTAINISEYEFNTAKDRILLLILKLKLVTNEKFKELPDEIDKMQEEADDIQEGDGQIKEHENKNNLDIQEDNILLPLIEQFDSDEYKLLQKKHKLAKPISLKSRFNNHFGADLTYEDVEILDVGGDITQRMMVYLINYLLYQNQKKLMRKMAMAILKIEDESEKYFSYKLRYPEQLQDQLIPDRSKIQFMTLFMKYHKKWVLSIIEPQVGRGLIADFRHNEKIKKKEDLLLDVKDVFAGDFNINLKDVYTYYKCNRDGQFDGGLMVFYYMYKFLNARSYEQIQFNNDQEKKEMKDRLFWLILKLQYIEIQPEFDQNPYFMLRGQSVFQKQDGLYEDEQGSSFDSEVGVKPKHFRQEIKKKNLTLGDSDEDLDFQTKSIKRQHDLVPPPETDVQDEDYDEDVDYYQQQEKDQHDPYSLTEEQKRYLEEQKLRSYEQDHPQIAASNNADKGYIYFNQEHRNDAQQKHKDYIQQLYKEREKFQKPDFKNNKNMSYEEYQKQQLAWTEHERKIKEAEKKLLPKSQQKALELQNQQKNLNTIKNYPDATQKLVNTALNSLEQQGEFSQNSMVDELQMKNQNEFLKQHPNIPHLDSQYQQFLFDKYSHYIPKNAKTTFQNQQTQTQTKQKSHNRTIISQSQMTVNDQEMVDKSLTQTIYSRKNLQQQQSNNQKSLTQSVIQKNILNSQQSMQNIQTNPDINNINNNIDGSILNSQQSQPNLFPIQQQSQQSQQNQDEDLEKKFESVLSYVKSHKFNETLAEKPKLAEVVQNLRYNFSNQVKKEQEEKQLYNLSYNKPSVKELDLKKQLGDSIDQLLMGQAYINADQKYKEKYLNNQKQNINKNNNTKEILKLTDQYYSEFYLKTRNDISMPNAYINQRQPQHYNKSTDSSSIIANILDFQISQKELDNMAMIDEITQNLINLKLKLIQNSQQQTYKNYYFAIQFSQNNFNNFQKFEKYIPQTNLFEHYEYLAIPYQNIPENRISHLIIINPKLYSCKIFSIPPSSKQQQNQDQISLNQNQQLEKQFKIILKILYNHYYKKDLNEKQWKIQAQDTYFTLAKNQESYYLLFIMLDCIHLSNTNFSHIENYPEKLLQKTKQQFMTLINQHSTNK